MVIVNKSSGDLKRNRASALILSFLYNTYFFYFSDNSLMKLVDVLLLGTAIKQKLKLKKQ
jgi:hypothetical protein